MVTLTLGTVEYVPIKVFDALGNLTTLDGTGLTHDLYRTDEAETPVYTGRPTANDGMVALPLIDTSTFTEADQGEYNIFLNFTLSPELPRLGPFRIRIYD